MIINDIKISCSGYIYCKSSFYSAQDLFSNKVEFNFFTGTNKLVGEIDSGVWAISYLISMYEYQKKDFILHEQPIVMVNNKLAHLSEISKLSCYIDESYPLFSSNVSVRKLITKGLKKSEIKYSVDDIKNIFSLDDQRFERPLRCIGNERFRAMTAIGYSYGKEIFCFPWFSNKRFECFHNSIPYSLKILEHFKKISILPLGMNPNLTGDS